MCYGKAMKAVVFLAPLLAIGCDRAANSFEVHAPEAVSAELQLCGTTTSLERSEDRFKTSRAINCEGAGAIAVHFQERQSVTCPIGYVTPGLAQSFHLKVEGGRCVDSGA